MHICPVRTGLAAAFLCWEERCSLSRAERPLSQRMETEGFQICFPPWRQLPGVVTLIHRIRFAGKKDFSIYPSLDNSSCLPVPGRRRGPEGRSYAWCDMGQ